MKRALIRTIWASLAAISILVSGPGTVQASGRLSRPETAARHNLIVMSYNIHFGVGIDQRYSLQRVISAISDSHADLVGLQEVDSNYKARSQFEDQMRLLASNLRMHYFYAPIYDFEPLQGTSRRRQSGVAVLSKYPIAEATNHEIMRLSTETPNPVPKMMPGFADTVIQTNSGPVRFYVTHLDYRPDKRMRIMQTCEMMSIVKQHTLSEHLPNILVGDLNASPWEPEMAPILQKFVDPLAKCEDCFSYPSDSPKSRVDYVLVTPDIHILSANVMDARASDHRPVVADLVLPRSGGQTLGKGRA